MSDSKENPMKIPASFIPYLEKHRIYGFFQDLLGKLIVCKPDDHLIFLRDIIAEFIKQQTPTSTFYISDENAIRKDEIKPNEAVENNLDKKDNSRTSQELPTVSSKESMSKLDVKAANDGVTDNTFFTKEYSDFCEEVISDWKKLRRSKKWFSIKHLLRRNDLKDDDEISSTFEKTLAHTEPRISLTFHTNSDLYPADTSEEDWNREKQSIRNFNIKFSKDGKAVSQNLNEHVIRLSVIDEAQTETSDDEERKSEDEADDKQVELSEDNKDDVTPFVIKLVQETANEIMRNVYAKASSTYPKLHERELEKTNAFPRGPYMIPRVVILGPPGSGKTLQASLLAKRLKLIHLEMDEILIRENKRNNNIPQSLIDSTFRDSDLMTEVLISVIEKRILEEDCFRHGWVLTGFPITASQAFALDKLETSPNRFIYLDKSLDVCRDVLLTRIYNMETGQPLLANNDEGGRSWKSFIEDHPDSDTGLITILDNKYLMESESAEENACLIHSVARSAIPELTILKPLGKFLKAINHSFCQHEAAKSMLLHYYGGWCKKLKVDNLPPKSVHEAVVSVVVGPFPSFEEATIYDRTAKKMSTAILSSEIESELRMRLNEFLSREMLDILDTNV